MIRRVLLSAILFFLIATTGCGSGLHGRRLVNEEAPMEGGGGEAEGEEAAASDSVTIHTRVVSPASDE